MPPSPVVFARYSWIKAPFFAALLGVVVAFSYQSLWEGHGADRFWGGFFFLMFSPFLLAFLYQIIRHRGRALYLRGDTLYCFPGWPYSVPIATVRDAAPRIRKQAAKMMTFRIPGVRLRFRKGGSTFLPSGGFSEKPEIVAARLQAYLDQYRNGHN